MAVFDNVLSVLRQWEKWKRIEESPDRVDALEARLSELEQRLEQAPGAACPKCGALEFRTDRTEPARGPFSDLGAIDRHLLCGTCGHTETHMET